MRTELELELVAASSKAHEGAFRVYGFDHGKLPQPPNKRKAMKRNPGGKRI